LLDETDALDIVLQMAHDQLSASSIDLLAERRLNRVEDRYKMLLKKTGELNEASWSPENPDPLRELAQLESETAEQQALYEKQLDSRQHMLSTAVVQYDELAAIRRNVDQTQAHVIEMLDRYKKQIEWIQGLRHSLNKEQQTGVQEEGQLAKAEHLVKEMQTM